MKYEWINNPSTHNWLPVSIYWPVYFILLTLDVSIIRVHWRNIFQNILPRCIAVASEFWSYASCKNSSRCTCYSLRHFSNDRNNNVLERAYKQSWNSLYFFRNDGHVLVKFVWYFGCVLQLDNFIKHCLLCEGILISKKTF